MKRTLLPLPSVLKPCLLLFLFLFSFVLFAQEEGKLECGTTPIEDAYLRDPFYGNS